MSADEQDFEVVDAIIDDDNDQKDAEEVENNDDMIASDVQFVNSQSISQSVSLNTSSHSMDDSIHSQSMPPSPPHSESEAADSEQSDLSQSPPPEQPKSNKCDNEKQEIKEKECENGNFSDTEGKKPKKLSDNPYLTGQPTPNGPNGEESDYSESENDESDNESDEDDDVDFNPPHFTMNDEDYQSNEEKDEFVPKNDKKNDKNGNYAKKQQQQQQQSNGSNYLNIVLLSSMIPIIGIFAYFYMIHIESQSNLDSNTNNVSLLKAEPPKFHCPQSVIYVPMDGHSFYINASHVDHPVGTKYEWEISNNIDTDNLFIDGEDTSTLLLITEGISPLEPLNIDLSISYFSKNVLFDRQCSVNVMFHESPYFGIDLGTTYSCIAYQDSQQKKTKMIVADIDRAEYCIPTAIYFPKDSNKVIIGEDALKKLAFDPQNVIFDIKRIVGRNCNGINAQNDEIFDNFVSTHSFKIRCSVHDKIEIFVPNLNNEWIAPEQALSVILAHLVEIASKEFGVPYLRDVVVSIPALFHNGQRKAIRSAANLVGLNVKQLVVEPTAAALAYSYYSSTPKDNFKLFLTFDFGGGTIDCSVLRCTGVDCQVLGVKGNSTLGGIDFDYVIKEILIEKYINEHNWQNIVKSDKLNAKFLKVAERVKKSLSVSTQHQVTMTNDELSITEKKQVIITRSEFENHPQTQSLIDSAINTAKSAINSDRIKASNIRMILLIGGTTKIPIIQRRLYEEFGHLNGLKLVFPKDDDPQLMVVKGSAIIGGSLSAQNGFDRIQNSKQIVLEDVIPLSLGFSICTIMNGNNDKTECGVMDVIIEKNSHYPTKAQVKYCQKDPNSSIAKLDLYEGDDAFVANNYFLSHLSISGIPKREPDVCDSIIVQFIIDKDGIATIEAVINDEDKTAFRNSLSVVSNDGNLSKGDIKMLKKRMILWFDGHDFIQSALID